MGKLGDGLTVFVKRECETCVMVVAVLERLTAELGLTIVTQDDPTFPEIDGVIHDSDLSLSWHNHIETVPTLIRRSGGQEVERTAGWDRFEWERLTGLENLGSGGSGSDLPDLDLPDFRPGCGSISVDPDRVDELAARFGSSSTVSRRIDFAELEDQFEAMHDRGWSDGLPLVPPTPDREAIVVS